MYEEPTNRFNFLISVCSEVGILQVVVLINNYYFEINSLVEILGR